MSTELVMPSNHLILCHPLLLPPSIFPSIRVISNESVLRIRWPKYWSFSFSISPSNEYSGLISFRMGWLDLFTVQGVLSNTTESCSTPQDSQESCPTPQFKSINSSVLSFLYSPSLTSIHAINMRSRFVFNTVFIFFVYLHKVVFLHPYGWMASPTR